MELSVENSLWSYVLRLTNQMLDENKLDAFYYKETPITEFMLQKLVNRAYEGKISEKYK